VNYFTHRYKKIGYYPCLLVGIPTSILDIKSIKSIDRHLMLVALIKHLNVVKNLIAIIGY